MDNSNSNESPQQDSATPDSGTPMSNMGDNNQPMASRVSEWALVGAGCGVIAPVLSVVIAFCHGRLNDKGTDQIIGILWIIALVILLVPIGAVTGAIVGFFLRNRNGRDEPRNTNMPSLPP